MMDNIGKCNYCEKKDVEIDIDTGWCDKCVFEYEEEQERRWRE